MKSAFQFYHSEKDERNWPGGFNSGDTVHYKGDRARVVSCQRDLIPEGKVPIRKNNKNNFIAVSPAELQKVTKPVA